MFILLYADDTIILAESVLELQSALNAVKVYCDKNFLKVNLTKTKVIVFSRGKIRKIPEFFYGNDKVDVVDDYIYLGVTFNYNNSFTKAINKQIDQARKAMYSMLTKSRRLMLSVELQIEMFDKTVLPILLYGSEVWGCANISDIEVFYRRFLKIILKLGKATPNCMVYGETGKMPLQLYIEKRMLSFWIKVSEDKEAKISRKMYKIMLKLQNLGEYNFKWLRKIQNILDATGNHYLWEMQSHVESKLPFYSKISQTIYDCILSNWGEKVHSGSRCTNYKIYKHNLEVEFYLTNLSLKHRITMSRFRCGYNRLPANKYNGSESERKCNLCDAQDVGDEFHYLFVCDYFKRDRNLYLDKYFIVRPNTLKMDQLFNVRNKKMLRNLATFQALIMCTF